MKPRFLKKLRELQSEIDSLKLENEQLKKTQIDPTESLKHVFNQTPGIAVQGYDQNRLITYWNHSSEKLYGYTAEEVLGKKIEEIIVPEQSRIEVVATIKKWLKGEKTLDAEERWMVDKNGALLPIYSQHVMIQKNESEREMFCVNIDLRDLKKAESMLGQVREFYTMDFLTGLKNKFYYNQSIDAYLDSIKDSNKLLVYCLLDLDNFKSYNEIYGHNMGDEVLRKVGKVINSCLTRSNDLAVRYGGEEFLILYTVDKDHNFLGPVHNILRQVQELQIEHVKNNPYNVVTLSGGATAVDSSRPTHLSRLDEIANNALNEAKTSGKNRYSSLEFIA